MLLSKNIKSSLLFYVGNFLLSLLRYAFHIILLRLLTPDEYGEFLTYLSLMYILSVPNGTISTIVTKAVSSFVGNNQQKSVNSFFYFIGKKTVVPAAVICLIILLSSGTLSDIFKANKLAFVVLGISALTTTFQTVVSSYLLGLQLFVKQTIFGLISTVLTIVVTVLLINLGSSSLGAVIGQVLGGLLATLLALYWLVPFITPKQDTQNNYSLNLASYANFSFLNSLATMSLISLDILMVRALLPTHQSGIYSSLSVIGRTIIFGLSPISILMLTVSAKKFAAGTSLNTLFFKLGTAIFVLGAIGGAIFNLFPVQISGLLAGDNFKDTAQYLGIFAISMVLFSWSQFVLAYFNGSGRERYNIVYILFALLQPVLIYVLGTDLQSLTYISLYLHLGLFLILLILLLQPVVIGARIKHAKSN